MPSSAHLAVLVLSSAKVVDRLIADVDGTGNARDPIAGTHAG